MEHTTTPPAKQVVATLPFRSVQLCDEDSSYDVTVWRGDLACERSGESPCDTSGLFYGSAEDEVTKFCARHFYEMHCHRNAAYRLADPPVHSPGPWTVMVSPADSLYVDNGKRWIATLTDINITPEECRANANLIAAAPDLLAVCNDLAGFESTPNPDAVLVAKSIVFRGMDAAAKATGRA